MDTLFYIKFYDANLINYFENFVRFIVCVIKYECISLLSKLNSVGTPLQFKPVFDFKRIGNISVMVYKLILGKKYIYI